MNALNNDSENDVREKENGRRMNKKKTETEQNEELRRRESKYEIPRCKHTQMATSEMKYKKEFLKKRRRNRRANNEKIKKRERINF